MQTEVVHFVVASIRRSYAGDAAMVGLLRWPLMLVGIQVIFGAMNVALAAPGAVQIGHLLLAQLVWISCCTAWLAMGRAAQTIR